MDVGVGKVVMYIVATYGNPVLSTVKSNWCVGPSHIKWLLLQMLVMMNYQQTPINMQLLHFTEITN